MKKWRFKRYLSLVLVLVLLVNMYPIQSLASVNSGDAAVAPIGTQSSATVSLGDAYVGLTDASGDGVEEMAVTDSVGGRSVVSVMYEVEELREEDTKHFRLSDGSFVAVAYGVPVHYQDEEGQWQDIDNSLVVTADNGGVSTFRNAAGDNEVSFAATLGIGKLFTAAYEDVAVSMSLLDTAQADAQITTEVPSLFAMEEVHSWDVEDVMPKNLQSTLLYEDVFPGIDLQYTAYSYNIKEQVIVNELQEAYCYDFLLELEGLTSLLNEDGSISLLDGNGETVYEIPRPIMEDSAGEVSLAVSYTLTSSDQGTVLRLDADKEWINSPDRTLPVKIDPTIIFQPSEKQSDLYTSYVSEALPDTIFHDLDYIYTGVYPNETIKDCDRIFIHVANTPAIPAGCEVVDARLYLYEHGYLGKNCDQFPIGLYEVTTAKPSNYTTYLDWFSKLTWNTQPSYNKDNVIDYAMAKPNAGFLEWNMSELVKKWYLEKVENTSIALVMINEDEVYANNGYGSAQISVSGVAYPVYTISYRNTAGMEPYYTYATLDAGNAGTGYLADHSGQLKVANTLLSYASVANPFALEMVYNSDYFRQNEGTEFLPMINLGLNMHMGSGWTLNVVQKIEETVIGEKNCLKYRDGDGTDHYFYQKEDSSDTLYYDEDGLNLKIRKDGTGSYTMSDDNGNSCVFTNHFLTSITDSDGNVQKIYFNESAQISRTAIQNNGKAEITTAAFYYDHIRLIAVNDAAGNQYAFNYSEDGKTLNGVTMWYNENGQTKSRKLSEYSYAGFRLSAMKDVDSAHVLEFTYADGRVSGVQEKSNGSLGAQMEITYSVGQKTEYLDKETNLRTHYLFDYEGRTVNAYTTYADERIVLGATNAVYHKEEKELDKSSNRITQTASIGKAAQSLMKNGGMEDPSIPWYPHGGGEVIHDPEKARTGNYVFKGTLSASNTYADNHILSATLTAGKTYTFSAYVNTKDLENFTGTGVYVQVVCGSDVWYSNRVDYATADCVNDGWVRVSVTFTAKTTAVHTLCICGNGAQGSFYADDVQLEEANAPSNVNLMENGSISMGNYGWTLGQNASYNTAEGISPGSIRINGDCISVDASAAYQVIPINLPGTESYVLSGWVKANAVPDDIDTVEPEQDKNKQCGLRAIVSYSDGSAPDYYYVAFDPDIDDWQFVSMPIVPKQYNKTVASIQVICAYEKNANVAYFDDLSLVRELAQTMVYRDGKLTSVTATDLDTENYTYDGNNNLIQMATSGNGVFNYTYDTTYVHRLTSASNGQITQSMSYDSVGNTTSSKLTNATDGRYMETSTVYTSDGNHVQSTTDAAGGTVSYNYGSGNTVMWELPVSVTDAKGAVTTMEYDSTGRLVEKSNGTAAEVGYTYDKGLLKSISRTASKNGTNVTQIYTMSHDNFGNMTSIKVGNRNLATYEYDSLRRISKMNYGNGQAISYTYDTYGRTETVAYPDGRRVTYAYNGDGSVHSIRETGGEADSAYVYEYDSLGRLMTWEKLSGLTGLDSSQMYVTKDYDINNRLIYETWKYPMDLTFANRYSYNLENGTMSAMDVGNDHATFVYDGLLRLTGMDCGILTRNYVYRDITSTKTTSQVSKLKYPNIGSNYDFEYTYDANGYVASYTDPDNNTTTYTYDAQGQLVRAAGNRTYTYTYDGAGNMLTSNLNGTNHTYTYGNGDWKDLLTAFDNQTITYDQIGNPLSYYNGTRWNFTWGNGRNLKTATNGTDSISYTYEADGQRVTKTVNGVVHTYYYADGLLRRETYGDTTLDFFYDGNGVPFSMLQNRSTMYYYVTNMEGDVIRLVDWMGNIAAMYQYDPYGGEVYALGSHAEINPLRYRGYYYDAETKLYYLNSRYYDPGIGRFISADSAISGVGGDVGGYNLYSYCMNNPVNMSDLDGNWPKWLSNIGNAVKNAVDAVVNAVKAVVNAVKEMVNTVKTEVVEVSKKTQNVSNTRPPTGEPGSTYVAPNGDKRTYGQNGKPVHDYDHSDHGNPKNHPHDENGGHHHDWDWTKNPPRQGPYVPNVETLVGVGLVVVSSVGIAVVALDDCTVIGIADNFLYGPLGAGISQGLIMIY